MDTFRKWLNKPKADDKSLLARFYHADRSLTAVASELDSFDGRAEPDRCSRLVSRLRQGQDKVLSITNMIMQELLGDDRASRTFRVKFPDEVLQENLAGQLWFGAECLAAGSSIMNREQESKEMRPLAQAVTKSLGNVRNLLREQCLRNNVPNSKTLHLDANDSTTEQLYESLKIFDRLFADFELRYVSAMVQVKTKHEYEMQELICVLFSETLQRALKVGLLEQDKVDAFDPALMFSIPRLAIIAGLIIYPSGPLDMTMSADQLSEMFRPFRTILIKVRDLLHTLSKKELLQLEKLLCTNEDINTTVAAGTSSIEAPYMHSTDTQFPSISENRKQVAGASTQKVFRTTSDDTVSTPEFTGYPACTESHYSICTASSRSLVPVSRSSSPDLSHSSASITSGPSTSSPTDDWTDDDDEEMVDGQIKEYVKNYEHESDLEDDIGSAGCASGYLIPNTNFGNLLQSQEVPLNGNFVVSVNSQRDVEFEQDVEENMPTTSGSVTNAPIQQMYLVDSSAETSGTVELLRCTRCKASACQQRSGHSMSSDCRAGHSSDSCSDSCKYGSHTCVSSSDSSRSHNYHHRGDKHVSHHLQTHDVARPRERSELEYAYAHSRAFNSYSISKCSTRNKCACSDISPYKVKDNSSKKHSNTTASVDTTSVESSKADSPSGVDPAHKSFARASPNRIKFKGSTENLLHRLFVCVAGVADQLQTNFASDLRQILRGVFLMNMQVAPSEVDIPEKAKDTELFEFRASETDVIEESSGSNQSIYSAEEVNPEVDVFNNNNNNNNSGGARTHDDSTFALGGDIVTRTHIERSRSLGDHDDDISASDYSTIVSASTNSSQGNTRLAAYVSGQRRSVAFGALSDYRDRNNSVGSNSPSSRSSTPSSLSEVNSPVNRQTLPGLTTHVNLNNYGVVGTDIISPIVGRMSPPLQLSPPEWVPDDKAPRCMACHTPFTAFRRRHHCRNCGGVFCGVCSNASAPLPKYGLTKAVRVCRDCYRREVRANSSETVRAITSQVSRNHSQVHSSTTTAGGS